MSKDFERGDDMFHKATEIVSISAATEPVTAFVGPAPRGPVASAISISSVEAFDKQFGVPDYHCRMGFAIRQFFANGGRNAVVVRVSACTERNRIVLRGETGNLVLQACNPGPLEFLRASVDYDSIPADETRSFNIVIQRLRTENSVWIDEQEYFRGVNTDPNSRDYIGKVLVQSQLVRLQGIAPDERPELTIKPGSIKESGYVSAVATRFSCPVPSDYDLVGSRESGTGLSALERVNDVAHVCLISGAQDAAIGPVAMLAADNFCRRHQALLIVDPPARWKTVDDVVNDQRRSDFSSPNTVTWFPCVELKNASGDTLPASATGAVAAALTEAERTRGLQRVHEEAMTMPRNGLRPLAAVSAEDSCRLVRAGINTLIQRSALHLQLSGNATEARHASFAGGFGHLDMRARVLLIGRRIRIGTRWVVAHDGGTGVRAALQTQLEDFMRDLQRCGLLAGAGAGESWLLKPLGEASDFTVGVALCKPREYFGLRFQHYPDHCTVTELGWQSALALAS